MQLVKNELYATDSGTLRPRPTEQVEELPVDMVFRSVGYRGLPLQDVPFDERRGVIANAQGRVLQAGGDEPLTGIYASGWIKRGPTGVIGTNKSDALETVKCMVADAAGGKVLEPNGTAVEAAANLVRERQPEFFSYAGLAEFERAWKCPRGRTLGRRGSSLPASRKCWMREAQARPEPWRLSGRRKLTVAGSRLGSAGHMSGLAGCRLPVVRCFSRLKRLSVHTIERRKVSPITPPLPPTVVPLHCGKGNRTPSLPPGMNWHS